MVRRLLCESRPNLSDLCLGSSGCTQDFEITQLTVEDILKFPSLVWGLASQLEVSQIFSSDFSVCKIYIVNEDGGIGLAVILFKYNNLPQIKEQKITYSYLLGQKCAFYDHWDQM